MGMFLGSINSVTSIKAADITCEMCHTIICFFFPHLPTYVASSKLNILGARNVLYSKLCYVAEILAYNMRDYLTTFSSSLKLHAKCMA